jgi:hypothetical protein
MLGVPIFSHLLPSHRAHDLIQSYNDLEGQQAGTAISLTTGGGAAGYREGLWRGTAVPLCRRGIEIQGYYTCQQYPPLTKAPARLMPQASTLRPRSSG